MMMLGSTINSTYEYGYEYEYSTRTRTRTRAYLQGTVIVLNQGHPPIPLPPLFIGITTPMKSIVAFQSWRALVNTPITIQMRSLRDLILSTGEQKSVLRYQ